MSDGNKIIVDQGPYVMVLMHALKHSSSAVNGVLLGKAGKRDNGSTEMRVTEAVPLLHSHLALAPALDGAFSLVDQYCANKGLGIVGYYHANAHHMHNDLTPLARRIADKVAEVVRDTKKWVPVVCMQVDNESLDGMAEIIGHGEGDPAQHTGVRLLQKSQSGWSPVDKGVGEIVGCDDGSSQILLCNQVAAAGHVKVVDFDDHLNDTSKAWLSPILDIASTGVGSSNYTESYPGR